MRIGWLGVAAAAGPAIDSAYGGSNDTATTMTIVTAVVWVAGVLAMAVPSVAGLTATCAIVPLTIVFSAVVMITRHDTIEAGNAVLLMMAGVLASLVASSAELGKAFVQASAYGDEDRTPLRPPVGYLSATAISWAIWAAGMTAAAIRLGTEHWISGTVIAIATAGLTVLVAARWHRLSRRWLVIVPVGVVVHDQLVLAETMMLRRHELTNIHLALAGTDAADLTGGTAGNAVEVNTRESVTVLLRPRRPGETATAIHLTGFLVSPSRPGAVLRRLQQRGLPVG